MPCATEQAKILHAIQPSAMRGSEPVGSVDSMATALKAAKKFPHTAGPDVAPDSRTETFVAMELLIDNCAGLTSLFTAHGSGCRRATRIS